jgi:putative salt-induced outer membrane protein YdiY
MRRRFLQSLGSFVILAGSTLAADHVVLTNGDTLTGTIVKKDGDTLTFKTDLFGVVAVPWKAVKSVASDAELNVVMPSGDTVKGKLSTAGDQLQVATSAAPAAAPLSDVKAVRDAEEQHNFERLLHPGLLELWTGAFDFGFADATGNARNENITTAFNANRTTRTDKITLYFNQLYGTARVDGVNSTTANAVRGGWKYDRNVSPRAFLTAFNDYEHDQFQNLSIRFVAGGGAGFKAIKSKRTQLDVDAGVDYQRENFMDATSRNSAEVNFGDNLLFKVSKVTTVSQSARMFANLTDGGVYRLNFDLSAATAIKKWLGWHVTVSDRFLSNPVQGRERNDLILSTGFRLSFAR